MRERQLREGLARGAVAVQGCLQVVGDLDRALSFIDGDLDVLGAIDLHTGLGADRLGETDQVLTAHAGQPQ